MPFRTLKNGTVTNKSRKRSPIVIPTAALAEWRNPPRSRKYQRKIKSATWEDSSAPFHYARNDIIGGWFRSSTWVVFATQRNGTQADVYSAFSLDVFKFTTHAIIVLLSSALAIP